VYQIRQTDIFEAWLEGLPDHKGKARILARLESARLGNLGDAKNLKGGLQEMRVQFGPGYRLYFTQRQRVVIILLCGGDKSSQERDISRAKRLLQTIG
jgi:putative addiction module killer protein